MTNERFLGNVVWFNDARGYGFIRRNNDGKEFFIHFSNIVLDDPNVRKTLLAEQSVSFSIGANQRGPQAIEVVIDG